MKFLIGVGILAVVIIWPVMRMSSLCSREEEREWDGK